MVRPEPGRAELKATPPLRAPEAGGAPEGPEQGAGLTDACRTPPGPLAKVGSGAEREGRAAGVAQMRMARPSHV